MRDSLQPQVFSNNKAGSSAIYASVDKRFINFAVRTSVTHSAIVSCATFFVLTTF